MIYSELIPSGDTVVLRVSKQVHDEAKDVLYKQGICRLRFCHGRDGFDVLNPPESPLSKVQNFNIIICMRCQEYDFRGSRISDQVRTIDPALQPRVQGSGSCHVTLVFGGVSDMSMSMPNRVLVLLEDLGTFKLVTLRVHFSYLYHPLDRRNSTKMEPAHKIMLEQMSSILRKNLGDPEWKSEPGHGLIWNMQSGPSVNPFPKAPYLEFRPPRDRMAQLERALTVLHV